MPTEVICIKPTSVTAEYKVFKVLYTGIVRETGPTSHQVARDNFVYGYSSANIST